MADSGTGPKAAGWKRDPSGRFAGRYWDGSAWTEHVVAEDRVRSTDPLPAARPRSATPARSGPAVTETSTPTVTERSGAGAPTARPGGGWRAWPLWVRVGLPVALVVALVVAVAQGGNDDAPGPSTGTPGSKTLVLGTTARTDQFEVTVFGFKDPQPPGQFLKPPPGTHYVSVDVQLVNRGSTPQNFSSLLQIHLLDGSNRQYDPTFGEVVPPAPDGEIPAGQAVRGLALFEVPDGTTSLRVRVQGSLTAAGVYFALA